MAEPIIRCLERELGRPVVTSNASSLWKMLLLLGDRGALAGAGSLFVKA